MVFDGPFIAIACDVGVGIHEEAEGRPRAIEGDGLDDRSLGDVLELEIEGIAGECDVGLIGDHAAEEGFVEFLGALHHEHVGVFLGDGTVILEFVLHNGDGDGEGFGIDGEGGEELFEVGEVVEFIVQELGAAEFIELFVDVIVFGFGALSDGFGAAGGVGFGGADDLVDCGRDAAMRSAAERSAVGSPGAASGKRSYFASSFQTAEDVALAIVGEYADGGDGEAFPIVGDVAVIGPGIDRVFLHELRGLHGEDGTAALAVAVAEVFPCVEHILGSSLELLLFTLLHGGGDGTGIDRVADGIEGAFDLGAVIREGGADGAFTEIADGGGEIGPGFRAEVLEEFVEDVFLPVFEVEGEIGIEVFLFGGRHGGDAGGFEDFGTVGIGSEFVGGVEGFSHGADGFRGETSGEGFIREGNEGDGGAQEVIGRDGLGAVRDVIGPLVGIGGHAFEFALDEVIFFAACADIHGEIEVSLQAASRLSPVVACTPILAVVELALATSASTLARASPMAPGRAEGRVVALGFTRKPSASSNIWA